MALRRLLLCCAVLCCAVLTVLLPMPQLFPKYPTVSQQVFKTVLKAVADAERRGGKTLMRLKNSEWKKIREGKAAHKKQRVA